ncbi:MAG: hypothetical protein ACRDKJ_08840 [Actinomycetota bacterium]
MTMLHLHSAQHPFATPLLAFKAVRVLAVAESTGLWSAHEPVTELDADTFRTVLQAVGKAGVAPKATLEFEQELDAPASHLERFLDRVYEELRESPVPEHELPALAAIFGVDDLADLLSAGASTLRRYLKGERRVPDGIAGRAHHLALVVADLAGSYNDRGLRRWFDRPRPQLGGKTPRALLEGDWSPDDEGASLVAEFASELSGASLSSSSS